MEREHLKGWVGCYMGTWLILHQIHFEASSGTPLSGLPRHIVLSLAKSQQPWVDGINNILTEKETRKLGCFWKIAYLRFSVTSPFLHL